jgi:hypothetical protein
MLGSVQFCSVEFGFVTGIGGKVLLLAKDGFAIICYLPLGEIDKINKD